MALILATIKGVEQEVEDSLLTRKDIHFEDDNENTNAVEYWLDGELVHRSVHVMLKQSPAFAVSDIASLG